MLTTSGWKNLDSCDGYHSWSPFPCLNSSQQILAIIYAIGLPLTFSSIWMEKMQLIFNLSTLRIASNTISSHYPAFLYNKQ